MRHTWRFVGVIGNDANVEHCTRKGCSCERKVLGRGFKYRTHRKAEWQDSAPNCAMSDIEKRMHNDADEVGGE